MTPTKHWENKDMDDLPNEDWRPIVGFEGLYYISNLCRVRRVGQTITHNNAGRLIHTRYHPGRMLSQTGTNTKFGKRSRIVCLSKNGVNTVKRIKKLMAETWPQNQ